MKSFRLNFVSVLLLYFAISIDTKNNYIIDIERGDLLYYNKLYGDNVKYNYIKPNHSVLINASYDVTSNDIKSDTTIFVELFRIVNNVWKKIPLHVDLNLCTAFKQNQYMPGINDILNHGNITPCDVKMAHYYLRNFMPSIDFPSVVPSARYKAVGTIKLRKIELFKMAWYATLERA